MSTAICCNCKLADGEKPHPSNYWGCSHAREEIRRRRSQKVEKTTSGRVFSSSYTTPRLAFAAALSKQPEKSQQSQTYQVAVPAETTVVQRKVSATSQQKQVSQFRLPM
jgi:hypothetical protein